MSGFFEHLAAFDDSEREQERTAAAVANRRVERRFGSFVRSAVDADDRKARLDLIEDELRQVVADVVSEYGGDPSKIEASLRTKFAMDPYGPMGDASAPVPPPVPEQGAIATPGPGADLNGQGLGLHPCAQGHPNCAATPGGACSQRVQEPDAPGLGGFGHPMGGQAPMYSHTAAGEDGPVAPLFGDRAPEIQHHPDPEQSFESIDEELTEAPTAVGHGVLASDSTGLSDKPSPKMDKKEWKPNALNDEGNLKPIDTDGGRYKTEQHDVDDQPEYNHGDGDGSWRADSPVTEHEDLPSEKDDAGFQSGGEEHGDHTDTWSGKKDQADPVTNTALSARQADWDPHAHGSPDGPQEQFSRPEPCHQCGYPVENGYQCQHCGASLEHNMYDPYPQDQEDPGYMPDELPSYGASARGATSMPPTPGAAPGGVPGAAGGAYGSCPNCGGAGCPLCQGQQQTMAPQGVAPTVASADVDKNPLREIIESEFNGFMPAAQVQQAIAAFKKGK